MQQLTIFDAMVQFDESRANWIDVAGQFEECTVIAYIPEDALSPLEQWTNRWDDPERKRKEKIWRDYVTSIWHHIGFVENAWEKACSKLQKYRDEGKPCPMVIHRDKFGCFSPENVVEYL